MTHTIALVVAYRGTAYHGYQFQNDELPTVQLELERALSRVADSAVQITCAGRTDAGVHATHQVVHFQTDAARPDRAWIRGTNRYLPDDIAITWSGQMAPDFNARFSAEWRRYLYLIDNSLVRSPLLAHELTHEWRTLNDSLMHDAAQALVGEHDFTSFRAASCSARTPNRNIHSLAVRREGSIVAIDVRANAFLHHMVRNIAATLIEIGAGTQPVSWAADLLARKDRSVGAATAPPNGLYLVDVGYPDALGVVKGPDLPHLYSFLAS